MFKRCGRLLTGTWVTWGICKWQRKILSLCTIGKRERWRRIRKASETRELKGNTWAHSVSPFFLLCINYDKRKGVYGENCKWAGINWALHSHWLAGDSTQSTLLYKSCSHMSNGLQVMNNLSGVSHVCAVKWQKTTNFSSVDYHWSSRETRKYPRLIN